MVAFPQLKVKLALIDKTISENPNDPIGLTERGELRLDEGNLTGAIEDLSKALENKPDELTRAKAREKLYDSLTEYFQQDFNKGEKYLTVYEGLCKVEVPADANEETRKAKQAEERKRKANFLCLVAKGREAQGKLVEAFEKYQEFGALAADQALISVVDEPTVKAAPDVWSQGRIAAMIAKATPEQRKPLEDMIARKWADLSKKTDNLDEVRAFVNVFGSDFTIGKEARLALAERLVRDGDPKSILEAERHLYLLRGRGTDRTQAGRAVEMLAQLSTEKGLLEDAAFFYRTLKRDFADVVVRDGKTGAELFDLKASDKRVLPLLDEPSHGGPAGKVAKVDVVNGSFPYNQQVYHFGQVGDDLPFFKRSQLVWNFNMQQLKLQERGTNEDKWAKPLKLTPTNFQNLIYGNGQPNMKKFAFMNVGHLVVLPMGHMVFGIDPIRGEVLWEKNLYAALEGGPSRLPPGQQFPYHNSLTVDPRDGSIVLMYPDGWFQRISPPSQLEGSALVLQTREGLLAIDPISGRTLWTRTDVQSRSHIFQDDGVVYVIELDTGNNPASTRALRAADGVSVKIPDFTTQYTKRVRQSGRTILLQDNDPKGGMVMRLYDIRTGEDLWTGKFPDGSKVLSTESDHLAGVITPEGKLHVVDLAVRKEVLTGKVNFDHFKTAQSIHLLSDGKFVFVMANGPVDPNIMPFGGVQSNLMGGTGMRALPVNGYVYCFDLATSKVKYWNNIPNQMLVLDQFEDMPMLLFTARYNKWNIQGANRNVINANVVESYDKVSGKLLYKSPDNMMNAQNFHALIYDSKAGTIDLINWQMKIQHTLVGAPGAGTKTGSATTPGAGTPYGATDAAAQQELLKPS